MEKPGREVPGSMENTGCRGLWKTRGAGFCGKHGVLGSVENTGYRGRGKHGAMGSVENTG